MLDFIYQGEANIVQEDLDGFLLTAEEFQLNGLTGNNEDKTYNNVPHLNSAHVKPDFVDDFNPTSNTDVERKKLVKYPTSTKYGTLVPTESKAKDQIHIDEETVRKVAAMIQKQDKFWT